MDLDDDGRDAAAIAGMWRVFVSWQGIPDRVLGLWTGPETCREHPSWLAARQDALQMSCLTGARYVTVQDPTDTVVGEYDRYTNCWRQYPRALAGIDHTTSVTTEGCAAAAAWCTCGWSKFVFHGSSAAAMESAKKQARGFARGHEEDPCAA